MNERPESEQAAASPSSGETSEARRDERLETEPPYASPFTIFGRMRSFRHALAGLVFVLRSQHNAWLHAVATVLAVVLGLVLHWTGVKSLSAGEWCVLAAAVTVVWVAEAFNTGLEVMADAVTSERQPVVKIAKDVAAGAVLVAAVGATVVGIVLFLPALVELVSRLFGRQVGG
ncbi:MAG TPA: diacylglycerol kinase family protein [Phycisphaerae bacterium]|nr:diacylglycerol kinase family protein [Phycisphaerae bacterium]